jgi:hypothetical protein
VDDAVERLRDLPDLLYADLPALRVLAVEVEVVHGRKRQMTEGALRDHRRPRQDVGPGLEVGELFAVAPTALVAGADAANDPVFDQ